MRSLIMLLLASGIAHANVYPSNTGKVSVDVPDSWKINETDEVVKWVSSNDQVTLALWVFETTDVAQVTKRLEDELVLAVDDLTWGQPTKASVNGLAVSNVDGRATFQVRPNSPKQALDIRVMIAGQAPSKKGAVFVAIVAHAKATANKRALDAIFASVKSL
jgi:hypothetical protein